MSPSPFSTVRRSLDNAAVATFTRLLPATRWSRQPRLFVFHAWPDFDRKAKALADLLSRRGLTATVRSGLSALRRAQLRSSEDLWVGFWNKCPLQDLPRHFIFFNAEPTTVPDVHRDPPWLASMRRASEIWNYSTAHEASLRTVGPPVCYVPFGYAPYYEHIFQAHMRNKALAEDIDVLFVGSVEGRRKVLVDRLRELGLTVWVVGRDRPTYGEALDVLYARAKIVLGIHRFSDARAQIADLARFDQVLSNRRFAIHERPSLEGSDPEFEQVVPTFPYDEIPEWCRYFAAHSEERRKRAEAAYEWFRTARALDDFIPYERVRARLKEIAANADARSVGD